MKQKAKYIIFTLACILGLSACDEYEWVENEVELTPVIQATEFESQNVSKMVGEPNTINVYLQELLHIETIVNNANKYEISDLKNETTTENFNFSYTLKQSLIYTIDTSVPETDIINDTIVNPHYVYEGLKEDNTGTLRVYKTIGDAMEEVLVYNINIEDAEVYY